MQPKAKLSLILAFALALAPAKLFSQDLPDSFVRTQFKEYELWMEDTRLSNYLTPDTMLQEGQQAILHLKIQGLVNWQRLSSHVSAAYASDLSQVLLDRLLFLLDNAKSKIVIDARDALITIDMHDNKLRTDTRRTLGISDQFPRYNFGKLKNIDEYKTFRSNKKLDPLREEIKKYFHDYFEKYKARLQRYQFNDYSDNDSTLRLEINNVVDVVLQEGYFERIELYFTFNARQGGTDLSYRMTGKYASGIFWAPHESRYHAMTPKYQQEVDRFKLQMNNKIFQLTK